MKNLTPNRENCSQEELEKYIKIAKNGREKVRLLSIQMLFRGLKVLDVSQILCVSDVSIYNWVYRFNLQGLDGLLNRYRGGRPRLVSKESILERISLFEKPQKAGELHWTAKKFHGYLKEELGIKISYQTALNYLHEQEYKLKYGRSWPKQPEGNEKKRIAFRSRLHGLLEDPDVTIWYMDEAGFDGDPRPRRGWNKKGERKKIYRTQKHLRMNVSGMCSPTTGGFFALEFPYSNKETFQLFLNEANKEIIPQRKEEYLILDNASWHTSKNINWGRFKPIFLPPYSPDLNPIERIWAYLKQNFFSSFTAKNLEQLILQLDTAICSVAENKNKIRSITVNVES